MNNNIKDKAKEFINFVICLGVLLGIGYYTGILKGFSPDDFNDAYQNIVSNMSKNSQSKNDRVKILSTGNSTSQDSSSYEDYRLRTIPQTVIDGAYESNTWLNVFNADKKVVFYVYDPTGQNPDLSPEFNDRIQHYLQSKEMSPHYMVVAYTESAVKNLKTGVVGPSKICNSLEECNNQRKSATNYSNMAEFFKQCAKTACIINPANLKYVALKKRNYSSAVQVLYKLKEW